jgi:hypothetical protein
LSGRVDCSSGEEKLTGTGLNVKTNPSPLDNIRTIRSNLRYQFALTRSKK